MNEESAPSRSR